MPNSDNLSTVRTEKVEEIPLLEISHFPNHPFKVKVDEEMLEMAESVDQYGVLVPGLVRPTGEGGYEMISGHRRKKASELTGISSMPCIVREMEDDEATIIMVDSNLQRENIAPSEKAFAFKMKLEMIKRKTGRLSKENVSQVETKKRADEILGEQLGENRNQIQRYIRLTKLITPILEMVDEKEIAFTPAVELSYLGENEQETLYETMQSEVCTPSLSQAIRMKKMSQENKLDTDMILSILSEQKPNQKEKITIQKEQINQYFPSGYTDKQKEEVIVKLLKRWSSNRRF
ncbi:MULTISPECIES: ParB/RepB/Spo0J family partition protein [Bacillaceae]|uniref:Chromosome partitioning protein, ParB family n=2 Tax=Bacillaceae TaxID=186817 RepID=A0A1G8PY31_9BACI|nr:MULTISPECIES: ParB/RepB/Spo0J family partition protein [Bacillaceae]SDI97367.1 chromosome partitioning protein, ParB family [Natribacillus halophilus]